MKKLYCDRCGKECDSVLYEKIPDKAAFEKGEPFRSKEVELCHKCYNLVKRSTTELNDAIWHLRIAFVDMLFNVEEGRQ
jgi:hypothetical protein